MFAPVNPWTGGRWKSTAVTRGLPAWFATRVLAPVKLVTALSLDIGLAVGAFGIAGAALALAVSCFYLVRLARPGRRDPAGLAMFAVFGVLPAALLALRIAA